MPEPYQSDDAAPVALVLATPRSLPKLDQLGQRVVVLDIAFANSAGGQSFETLTLRFIERLGERLRAWVDHHDSVDHVRFRHDPRFVLRTKAQHPACPELVTPERVAQTGPIDTIVCHNDFDGLVSAAKWLRGGHECYPGADADARAVDSRIGEPSAFGSTLDRALRGARQDRAFPLRIVRALATGEFDAALRSELDQASARCAGLERNAQLLAEGYRPIGPDAVWLELDGQQPEYDKTQLLLAGQQQARIALVVDGETLTLAAPFDSGIDFLSVFGLSGGMPTVVSLRRDRLHEVLQVLRNGL